MMLHNAPSPDPANTRILLIGAGFIAAEYIKALYAMGYHDIHVLSRRQESADKLASEYCLAKAFGGGEQTLVSIASSYNAFIVAAPIESLSIYAELLAKLNVTNVLLEKPAFLASSHLAEFYQAYPAWDAVVALNRLYYPSVQKMREIIAEEGVTSVDFSFTEWLHRINPADYTPLAMKRWGLSNCIHVVSTVFDLIGLPAQMDVSQHGKDFVEWHPSGSIFTGHGTSERGVPFSYHSDWQSAGRWWINIRTPKGSYELCPMEGINFTANCSVQKQILMEPWNKPIKCGFMPMLEAWLYGKPLMKLSQLLLHKQAIEKIFGYTA